MGSTSVHLPAELVRSLDRLAKRRGVSRNRLITEACRSLVAEGVDEWPDDFFAPSRLAGRDLALLRSTFDRFTANVEAKRRNRTKPPF